MSRPNGSSFVAPLTWRRTSRLAVVLNISDGYSFEQRPPPITDYHHKTPEQLTRRAFIQRGGLHAHSFGSSDRIRCTTRAMSTGRSVELHGYVRYPKSLFEFVLELAEE